MCDCLCCSKCYAESSGTQHMLCCIYLWHKLNAFAAFTCCEYCDDHPYPLQVLDSASEVLRHSVLLLYAVFRFANPASLNGATSWVFLNSPDNIQHVCANNVKNYNRRYLPVGISGNTGTGIMLYAACKITMLVVSLLQAPCCCNSPGVGLYTTCQWWCIA